MQRVKEILHKRAIGDDLTSQEETILAYTYFAAGEQAVTMRVGSDTEKGNWMALSEGATRGVVV